MQVHRGLDRIKDAGADVAMIGNGTPNFIDGFREHTGWDGALYTDPSLATYRAAELKRGKLRTFNPLALGKTVKALSDGHRQGSVQGDAWQQGGVLVVASSGEVIWHHASDRPGDNASVDDIVAALAGVRS